MLKVEEGILLRLEEEHAGVQEWAVQLGEETCRARHELDWMPVPLEPGDRVWLNTTAVRLKLGTGGLHFVVGLAGKSHDDPSNSITATATSTNTTTTASSNEVPAHAVSSDKLIGSMCENQTSSNAQVLSKGHMMKLRYTPFQRSVLSVEEAESRAHELFLNELKLEQMPVLIGELHSMLPVAAAWLYQQQIYREPLVEREVRGNREHREHPENKRRLRVCYLMSDGGALPLSFSRHVRQLKKLGWIDQTITYGHAYGGDYEAMNKYTALIAGKWVSGADISLVMMGPGIAGTGTQLGHSGMEVSELINATSKLGGIPVVIPRISFADRRSRHQGLSHHLLTTLRYASERAILPLPADLPHEQRLQIRQQVEDAGLAQHHAIEWMETISLSSVSQAMQRYGSPLTTMGRGLDEEPAFFLGVCAASQYAWLRSGQLS
ncbi:DUF3866 family protein [Marinicrinis sediminis]|uniref:DUF3866 family protein n=1 Tax=Marinicrinis sediminis TaxID=1652465 RepID=A0ABW5RDP2_9BACL